MGSTSKKFDRYTDKLRQAMIITGIWPKKSDEFLSKLIWSYNLTMFCLLVSGQVAGAISIMCDVDLLVDNLTLTIVFAVILVKHVRIRVHASQLKKLIEAMESDWISLEQGESLDPNVDRSERLMMWYARIPRTFFITYAIVNLAAFLMVIIAAVNKRYSSTNWMHANTTILTKSWYPFDVRSSPIYEIIFAAQVTSSFMLLLSSLGADCLLMTITFHLCAQFEILRYYLKELKGSRKLSLDEATSKIKIAVKRHLTLVKLGDTVEGSYNQIILCQLLASSFSTCLAGFCFLVAIELGNVRMLFKFIFIAAAVLQQMLLYSITGHYLTTRSAAVGAATYETRWYELPPSINKMLLLMMIRAERPLIITAGKFYPMSLENFTGLLKTAASYLSVLWAMYSKLDVD